MSDRKPVAIFVIDSGEIELINRWALDGFMPNLSAIREHGVFMRMDDAELVNEVGTWVSLFSGVSKKDHGYLHFRKLIPGTYQLATTNPSSAKDAPAFWSYLSGTNSKVAIVDPPEFNVYDGLEGRQIANWCTHKSERLKEPLVAVPHAFQEEVLQRYGIAQRFNTFMPKNTLEDNWHDYQSALRRIATKGDLCCDMLSKEQFDLVLVGFQETHTLGHRLWHYQGQESNKLSHGIRGLCSAIDEQIGRVRRALPADANIFVLSAYGLGSMYPMAGLIDEFLFGLGYQTPSQPTSIQSLDLSRALRNLIPPAIRESLSNRLPASAQERSIARDFAARTDWSRTKAFALPALYTSMIRLNVQGREPQGIVSASDYESQMQKIEADLRLLTDPVTGKPAVRQVLRAVKGL